MVLTDRQVQKAVRDAKRLCKTWDNDVAHGRRMDIGRIERIARQDAGYTYDNTEKQAAHARIVAQHMAQHFLTADEYATYMHERA